MERQGDHVAARGNPHAGAVRADHAGALRGSGHADLEHRRAALGSPIPALLLQPLLENAFKHGVERSRDAVRIEIDGASRRRPDAHRRAQHRRSSLRSVAKESVCATAASDCSVLYGDAAQLQLKQLPDAVEASVTLPWQEHRA